MKKEVKSYMHVALVLDASGSMASLRSTTIETLRTFFAGLKSEEDKTVIDVWQFNNNPRHLVSDADLNVGAPSTLEEYETRGGTALYDAICVAIDELGRKFAAMPEEERPDGVIFAILTDGFENSSTDFTAADVKSRIAHQSGKYGWEFRFLAANQDAITAGRGLGIAARACSQIEATHEGICHAFLCEDGLVGGMSEMRMFCRERRNSRKRR